MQVSMKIALIFIHLECGGFIIYVNNWLIEVNHYMLMLVTQYTFIKLISKKS